MLIAALVLVLGACSKEDKVEMGISTGTLKEAAQDSITISSDDGLQQFRTTDETVYDLGGMDALNLDDVVDVEYHSSGDTMTADKIILREHVQKDLTFNGQVVDVTDTSVTVTGKSLTVSFTINNETEIKGEQPEPEPETKPEPDVIISGEGIIEAGDPETNTFTVTMNGTSVKLSYDENSKYATGYFPQPGDKVRIEYNKSRMLINDIQLIDRPVPAAAEASAEAAAE